MKSLRENIKYWGKIYGTEKLFFLTLTFAEQITCPKISQTRFNIFCTQFNRIKGVQWLYKGIEPQKSGRLHYHIIGKCDQDLGGEDFDWESLKKAHEFWQIKKIGMARKYTVKYSKTANKILKTMWKKVADLAKGSGFGRSEFLPVRSVNSIGSYVGKYLSKTFDSSNAGDLGKGVRRFSYSQKAPQIHGRQFSWVKAPNGLTWRQKVKAWSYGVGVKEDDMEDMRKKFGARWAILQKDQINYYGSLWFYMQGLRYGHARPSVYPTGHIGNPLTNMGYHKAIEDPFETSENDLWTDYLEGKGKESSLGSHAYNFKKYSAAQKAKKLHELIAR